MKRNILFILCYYCVLSLKRDAFTLNVFVHKHSRTEVELLTAFGGEVVLYYYQGAEIGRYEA